MPQKSEQCAICDSEFSSVIDVYLLNGHSPLCALWHLKRLGRNISADVLSQHAEFHRPFSLLPFMPTINGAWRNYVPPAVLRIKDAVPELLLIRGLPGSGKTRLALTYAETHVHLEADQFFYRADGHFSWHASSVPIAHLWVRLWTHTALLDRQNVVIANTFLTNQQLESFYHIAQKVGATVRVLTMPIQPSSLWPRTIPVETMRRYTSLWEPLDILPSFLSFVTAPDDISVGKSSLRLEAVAPFCQPFLCRHMLGERWLATIAHASSIHDVLVIAQQHPEEFTELGMSRLTSVEAETFPQKPVALALKDSLAALLAEVGDLRGQMTVLQEAQIASHSLLEHVANSSGCKSQLA